MMGNTWNEGHQNASGKRTPKQNANNSRAQKLAWAIRKENGTDKRTPEHCANISKGKKRANAIRKEEKRKKQVEESHIAVGGSEPL